MKSSSQSWMMRVRINHADLADNIWRNDAEFYGNNNFDDDGNGYVDDEWGWDAAELDNDPSPPANAEDYYFSHGTHCAGIAGGVTDNGIGLASISFNNARIMACKGKLDDSDGGWIDWVWRAFEYAGVNRADIISCSWGGPDFYQTEQNIITWAHDRGCIIVAAAGNEGNNNLFYPAAYDHVISVGNTGYNDVLYSTSSYGTWIDLCAPGTEILSSVATTGTSYAYYWGTSMSCPLVAGLLAQMKSYNPSASEGELIDCLLSTCDNINGQNPGYQGSLGAGRINARQALLCIAGDDNCTDNLLTLEITLDNYGSETTWEFKSGSTVLESGGPYPNNAEGSVYEEDICVPNGCYDLIIYDSEGDGLCCDYGQGFYRLINDMGEVLAMGDEFGQSETTNVCINSGNGCPAPTGIAALDKGYAFIWLTWEDVDGANAYQTRFRQVGSSTWNDGNWFSSAGVIWGNMTPCTEYEFQVRADCDGTNGSYSSSFIVSTEGCNDPYCYSYGLTFDDWIDQVSIGNINNTSGNDYGYGDYTNLSTTVSPGESYNLVLRPATDDNTQTVAWGVWIDFNNDSDFSDAGEQVYEGSGTNSQQIIATIAIPSNCK